MKIYYLKLLKAILKIIVSISQHILKYFCDLHLFYICQVIIYIYTHKIYFKIFIYKINQDFMIWERGNNQPYKLHLKNIFCISL
jgi:hypothetical protein